MFSLSLAAYPTPHASPLAQRARKAETGSDAVLKLSLRARRDGASGCKTLAKPGKKLAASSVLRTIWLVLQGFLFNLLLELDNAFLDCLQLLTGCR